MQIQRPCHSMKKNLSRIRNTSVRLTFLTNTGKPESTLGSNKACKYDRRFLEQIINRLLPFQNRLHPKLIIA